MPYEILDIESAADHKLRGVHIDSPSQIGNESGNLIEIAGWVVAAHEAIARIDVNIESGNTSSCIQSCPLDIERPDVVNHFQDPGIDAKCGFSASLLTIGLPETVRLSLYAITESDRQIAIAFISLRRRSASTWFQPKLQPIVVTTLGRTGSTWLMQLLAKHPDIVVADQHPYETFALEYWLHLVSQQLSAPWHSLSEVDRKRFNRDFIDNRRRQAWFDGTYYDQVLRFCQEAVENFYLGIAEDQGDGPVRFFAEKIPYYSGDGSTTWRQLGPAVRELYAEAREIVLVRDFRDMVLSALHFGAHGKSDEQVEREKSKAYHNVNKEVAEFSAYYKLHRSNTYLVRYEDLLVNTGQTLKTLFDNLSIPNDDDIMKKILEKKSVVAESHQSHITSKSIENSLARWKRELTPQLQYEYTDWFKEDLNLFGYEI
ncbi:MAG: sulfotransferase [Candidatus Thiodiazotropha sp.]